MGLGGSKDEPVEDNGSPEMAHMTKLYEEIVVLPGSIHKLLNSESTYTRSLFLLARHVLQPALHARSELSPPVAKLFEVLMRLTHEHLRLANAFSSFSILDYLEADDSMNGYRLGDLLLLLVPSVNIYMDYLHCFKQLPDQDPISQDTDAWLVGHLKQRFAQPRDLIGLLLLPLQRINELVDRLREVLLVLPNTYADFDSLRRSFTQHVLLQNMENCDMLKQMSISGYLCNLCGRHIGYQHKKRLAIWNSLESSQQVVHQGELRCRSSRDTSIWRSMRGVLMDGGHLLFYKEAKEVGAEQPIYVEALHRASLDQIRLPHHEHCLKLCCLERVYYMSLPSADELSAWVEALALEPSDALFQTVDAVDADQSSDPQQPQGVIQYTMRFTPSSSVLLNLETELPGCCADRAVMISAPCTMWSGAVPSPSRGQLFCTSSTICFVPKDQGMEQTKIDFRDITCLRRSNSAIVNCHSFRITVAHTDELCFAELSNPEDMFYKLEWIWHSTLQRAWHTINLLENDGDCEAQSNAIRSLRKLRSLSPCQLQITQLSEQANQWFRLPSDERLIERFGCSLIHKIPFTGHLYVTSNFLCFCSAQYGERVSVVIPLDEIDVEPYDSMMLMPCAIRVTTRIGDYLFGEFGDRDVALAAIQHHRESCQDSCRGSDDYSTATYLTEAESDTAYTCMETSELNTDTLNTDASEHTNKSEMSDDNSRRHVDDGHHFSDEDSDMGVDECMSPPESPNILEGHGTDEQLVDECGFQIAKEHHKLFKEFAPSEQARAQQRQVWNKHLKMNGSFIELVQTKALTQLTRFWGIPVQLRGMVWASCCGALTRKHTHPGYYHELLCHQPPSTVQGQIRKDLPRTLHGHEKYASADTPTSNQLHRVLSAYACHNPALGYCQAMNFLAAFLLVFMEEENAFWTLCCIVEQLLPDYFTYDMIGSVVDCRVFEELVQDCCPDIAKLLKDNQFYPGPKWFMGLFLNVLPFSTVSRVWDCFLCEGPTALFRIGLALLKLNSGSIAEDTDPIDFLQQVEKYAETCYDSTEILRVAFDDELSLSATRIRDLRARHRVLALHQRQQPLMKRLVANSQLSEQVLVELVCGFAKHAQEIGDEGELGLNQEQLTSLVAESLPGCDEQECSVSLWAVLAVQQPGEHDRVVTWKRFVSELRSGNLLGEMLRANADTIAAAAQQGV